MKRIELYLGIVAATVASCSAQEEDFKTPQQDDVVFYASFELPAEEGTRVYANEDLLLRWTADDRVSIFNKITYNQEYKFLGETGDNAGGFNRVDKSEFVTGNPISHVVSVYPYQAATKITEEEVVTLTLPAEQHYAENTFGLGANTMVSVSEDNVLQYKNVGGYLRLKLYGEGVSVSSISLKGNNGEKLAGKATVTMPLGGMPYVTMASDATTEITLSCETPVQLGTTDDNSIQFWFVVPPMSFSKGFTISITDADGRLFKKSTNKSIAIERNKLAKMTPLEIELDSSVIVFADPVVKAICIENWDTDRDGELSYVEAAAVTDIGDVFGKNVQITSFNELQYFTGLRHIGRPTTTYSGYYGFASCTNLVAMTLPNTLTCIGENAFSDCSALKSIDIPSSVETIDIGAFTRSGLISIDLPERVTIGGAAFLSTNITSLTIPGATFVLKSSDYSFPFSSCKSLSSVTFNGPISIIFNGWDSITYPNGYDSADPFFCNCDNLKTIYIGAAFSYDGKMPLGYTLGTGGFEILQGGVDYETISVSPENLEYDSRNNCNAIIETATNTLLLGCKNTIIPESVTAIGPWALSCVELSSITIPESVRSIGYGAIGSSSLSSVIFQATVPPSMEQFGLWGSFYSFPIYVPAESVNAYKTAEGWSDYADRIQAIPEMVLATNPYVQKYLEEVTYKGIQNEETKVLGYPGGGPGEADIPPTHTIAWTADASAGNLKFHVWEGNWSRDYDLAAGTASQDMTNLVPGKEYKWTVTSTADGKVVAEGSFKTKGLLHQVYFQPNGRNARDLGGWKGLGGKTLAFRKLYRGGAIHGSRLNAVGKAEFRAQGIMAEVDLREASDVPSKSPMGDDIAFFAPGFESGYNHMVRDNKPKVKETFCFVVQCLRENKPVYFHCSAGRDRTGTLAVLLEGVLGVSESDMAKDYELTYFSPEDWSMYEGEYAHVISAYSFQSIYKTVFSETDSGTYQERIEKYLLKIGVPQEDIDDFRALMLE